MFKIYLELSHTFIVLDLSTDAERQISTPGHMFYTHYAEKYYIYVCKGGHIFNKPRIHINILDDSMGITSNLGRTNIRRHCKNLFFKATWLQGFVNPCL